MKNEEEIIKTNSATNGDMERINYYRSKVAKDDDIFEFGCNGCGDCCRHRDESIILSGADVFRLARYLEVKPDSLFEKHLEWSIGKTSRLPVVYLHEKATGSCAFLHVRNICDPLLVWMFCVEFTIQQILIFVNLLAHLNPFLSTENLAQKVVFVHDS